MEQFFSSIFSNDTITIEAFFISLLVSIINGFILSFMCYYKSTSTKSFHVTISLIPAAVAMVIMLVNGNIGIGVAVAGAFGLVRFRSAQGNAREICILFIGMASGLAFGIGYLAYGSFFTIISGLLIMAFSKFPLWERKIPSDKILKIVIPENLDYNEVFNDLLNEYTSSYELLKVKSTNMGSMFQLTYQVQIKDKIKEKEFIDKLRCRNGNLEILLERSSIISSEL